MTKQKKSEDAEPEYENPEEAGKTAQSEQAQQKEAQERINKYLNEVVAKLPAITAYGLTIFKDVAGNDVIVISDFFAKPVLNIVLDSKNLQSIRGAFKKMYGA